MQQLIKDVRVPASLYYAVSHQRNRMKLVLERPCN